MFFPIVLILNYISKQKYRYYIIAFSNAFFILFLGWKTLFIISFSAITYFVFGLILEKKKRLLYLYLPIVVNVAILIFFKYRIQIVDTFPQLFVNSEFLQSVLTPIGISFYTFQGISYIVDIYRGEVRAQENFLSFFSYFAFFATITSGPITRTKDFYQKENKQIDFDDLYQGFQRIIFGLFKKIYISSRFAWIADSVYRQNEIVFGLAWLGSIAFMIQIYFDFSGYSDIVIGVSKSLGINLRENFNYPYMSKSLTDFWRRWHISLSQWFRDYIYIPLGGNRVSSHRYLFNMLVVWLLTGIWHGNTANFIVWGLFNFVIILTEKYLTKNILKSIPSVLSRLYTLIIINISWIFFRANNLTQALEIIKSLFVYNSSNNRIDVFAFHIYAFPLDWIVAVLLCTPLLRNIISKINRSESHILGIIYRLALIILLVIVLSLVISSSYQSFLYEAF